VTESTLTASVELLDGMALEAAIGHELVLDAATDGD
jgi:hypothetical protein